MRRRDMLRGLLGTLGLAFTGRSAAAEDSAAGDSAAEDSAAGDSAATPDFEPLDLPKSEWRKRLPAAAYDVLFEEGTERPGSSPLDKEKRPGTYLCAACMLPLFDSDAKYDSGTGWPSFFRPIDGRVGRKRDFLLIVPRTEYHCARCSGHQGHVFGDGPPPTGLRYCNNGVALRFVPKGEALPPLVES